MRSQQRRRPIRSEFTEHAHSNNANNLRPPSRATIDRLTRSELGSPADFERTTDSERAQGRDQHSVDKLLHHFMEPQQHSSDPDRTKELMLIELPPRELAAAAVIHTSERDSKSPHKGRTGRGLSFERPVVGVVEPSGLRSPNKVAHSKRCIMMIVTLVAANGR